MKRVLRLAVFVFLLVGVDAFAQPPPQQTPQVTAIKAGKLVVPETGATLTNPPDETRGTWTISLIDVFVEAGIPPKDILRALIPNAARLLGVEQQRGAISAGQFADIIATPENPLDNISTLKRVSFVMKNGKIFKAAK